MKRAVLVAVTLLLSIASVAQVRISVPTVGLNDTFSTSEQAVIFQVTNTSPQPAVYKVEVQLRWVLEKLDRTVARHKFTVALGPSQARRIEFPMAVPVYGANSVRILAFDTNGRELARRELKDPKNSLWNSSSSIIAGLCDDRMPHCTRIWISILANSNDEQTDRKQKKLSLIGVRNPGAHYWNYTPARYVILAQSAASLSPEIRHGIEEHVRMGGVLIWASKEVGPTDWLAAYRDDKPESTRVMGRGIVYAIPSIDSPVLSQLFNRETMNDPSSYTPTLRVPAIASGTYGFESRFKTHFDFPSLPWLLLWLLAYILVAGVANFAILRRLRRLEWGWLTVPAIAIIFAAMIFFISSARRPRNIILDQVAHYHMDTHSAVAAASWSVRVSSPSKVNLVLDAPSDAVWNLGVASSTFSATDIAREVFERQAEENAPELRYGHRTEHPIALLRWSYEDVSLEGFRTFKGSIVRVSPTVLRNETGIYFRAAMFVENDTKLAYMLDRVPAGAEIDLSKFKGEDIVELMKREKERAEKRKPDEPYRLAEILSNGANGTAFYALADGPTLGATLQNSNPEQHDASLFVVGME
jgi:hypothetical protein